MPQLTLLHPIISGNKWRKLKYILDHVLSTGVDRIVSMGGAYSNHLHALAYTGKMLGIKTTGIIRGEMPKVLNPTLSDIKAWGMQLEFVSRTEYRQLRQYREWNDLPAQKFGGYWIPEGGASKLALKGVSELVDEIDKAFDTLCVPCGTGATLAGIVPALPENTGVIGFAALKGADFLNEDVSRLLNCNCHIPVANWQINLDYHFGGFARTQPELLTFINNFEKNNAIPLEPIYTGKMMWGIYDLITKGYFKPGQRIVALHTGGLQGKRGFN